MSKLEQLTENIVALSDNVSLDGRISWARPGASGFEPHNKFVVTRKDNVLLLDTGVAAHGDSLLSSLESIVGSKKLTILVTRNELDCIGNLAAVLDRYPSAQVLTTNSLPVVGLVHPKRVDRAKVAVQKAPPGDDLSAFGFPNLHIVAPVIRVLGTGWVFDHSSGALFTSDFFGLDTLSEAAQSVVRRDLDGLLGIDDLRSGILQKFDWLGVADIDIILDKWDKFFAEFKPMALAPGHGRTAIGEQVVARALRDYRAAVAGASVRTSQMSSARRASNQREPVKTPDVA